jgi:sphingolipid delta-4 desaturase
VDIPTHWEGTFFTNTLLKLLWLIAQPLFYAFRPSVVRPKTMRPLDLFNAACIVCSDALLCYYFGPKPVGYLILSTLLGMGLHPVAGHFVAEHYVFQKGFETYSYYGALNYLCWNVGYHNEHHDFPRGLSSCLCVSGGVIVCIVYCLCCVLE